MFNDFLTNPKAYKDLEKHFYDHFHKNIPDGLRSNFDHPYYSTKFADGSIFMDGNPIFSAINRKNGSVLRIVIDQDMDDLTCFNKQIESGIEFVVVGPINLLNDLLLKTDEWISRQV